MILKICDRCGCEIKPKNNDPSAIKFGWTTYNNGFTYKTGIEPYDLCSVCMKRLAAFIGCEPKRIGVKDTFRNQEREIIKKEQEKHAK